MTSVRRYGRDLAARFPTTVAGRLVRRFVAASGFDRALALAAQAFVALIPASMLAAAYLGDRRVDAGAAIASRLHLSGYAAEAVEQMNHTPTASGTPGLVGGVVLIAVTGIGFTRALQRLYVSAWGMTSLGLRGWFTSVLAVVALAVAIASCVALGTDGPAGPVVQTLVAAALWLPIQRLLLGGRVTIRQLLPGAVVVGVGQTAVTLLSGPYLRAVITSQAERFGVIGVAFAVVSWLLLLSYLLVAAAVLSAEIAGAPMPAHPPVSPATDESDARASGQAPRAPPARRPEDVEAP